MPNVPPPPKDTQNSRSEKCTFATEYRIIKQSLSKNSYNLYEFWYSEWYFGPNVTKTRFQIKPNIFFSFFYYGIQ